MLRCLFVVAMLAGCGGSSPKPEPIANAGPATAADAATAVADAEPCGSTIEDHAPGNHDRFTFEDPATGLTGFKNAAGVVVIKPAYRFAYEFGPGGIAAAVDGTTPFVFIDPAGRVLARAYAFDNGPDYFQDHLARITDPAGKIGFIDDTGRIVIPPRFAAAASFCHGTAEVVEAGATFTIDRTGARVN